MAEFEEVCQALGLRLFVLPPRSPKLNGHVERMQRTFREEFYTRPLPSKIPELQRELDAYLDHYNRRRPHRALGGLAPLEYLARIRGVAFPTGKHQEAVPTESQMCWPTTQPRRSCRGYDTLFWLRLRAGLFCV
jgi:hypothetical protein